MNSTRNYKERKLDSLGHSVCLSISVSCSRSSISVHRACQCNVLILLANNTHLHPILHNFPVIML